MEERRVCGEMMRFELEKGRVDGDKMRTYLVILETAIAGATLLLPIVVVTIRHHSNNKKSAYKNYNELYISQIHYIISYYRFIPTFKLDKY